MLRAGFVGLPNTGKTTLFNAVTSQTTAVTANYAFSTSKPNVGVVSVPDERLGPLAKLVKTEKIVPATDGITVVLGTIRPNEDNDGRRLYNLAAVISNGRLVRFVDPASGRTATIACCAW